MLTNHFLFVIQTAKITESAHVQRLLVSSAGVIPHFYNVCNGKNVIRGQKD